MSIDEKPRRRTIAIRFPRPRLDRAARGQAILIIALAMVGLLAFTALAVDGGQLLFLRRDTQNAVDAAMASATFALCNGEDPVAPAMAAADTNGFNNDGVTNTVTVNNPPLSGPAAGDPTFVEVIITANIPGTFANLVYNGPLEVTGRAVGRCVAGEPGGISTLQYGIQALACGDVPGAVKSHGTGQIDVFGAGVHTDSTASGSGASASAVANGGGDIIIHDGDLTTPGTVAEPGGGTITPPASGGDPSGCDPPPPPEHDPLNDVEPPDDPDPGNPCQNVSIGAATTIGPGKYCELKVQNGDNLTMEPGLYYLEGDFEATGDGTVTGTNVIIYVTNGGTVAVNGGDITLDAPDIGPWAGMLLFMERSDPVTPLGSTNGSGKPCSIGGSGNLNITGTVYGRDSDITIEGGAGGLVDSALLGYTVDVGGSGNLVVVFDPDKNYKLPDPPILEVTE